MKNVEKSIHKKQNVRFFTILSICICFVVFCIVVFSIQIFAVNNEIQSNTDFVVHKNQNPVNLDNILQENLKNQAQKELTIEETDLEYTTIYRKNADLPNGVMQVVQEGRDGKQKAVVIKKYQNEELIAEELISENIIKASVNKIVEIGTGAKTKTSKPKVGDTMYVTSNILSVRVENNLSADKICTLKKDEEVKILAIKEDWYYIDSSEGKGYIPNDCVTNRQTSQNIEDVSTDTNQISKSELVKKLNFNMPLNQPSNLSLSQFEKILKNNAEDTNHIFEENAQYFYYAEKQYQINGVFLAAVAIHESGWGTSQIAQNKKNLFGYGANDENPYNNAYTFSTYAEGIDLLSRVFVKYYLNPSGTPIYDGNIATGKFYTGNHLSSVNTKYASDKNWASSVYKWMQYLYNKI